MKYLDLTFADPAANLACDEALLNGFNDGLIKESLLRTWQPELPFVVLGRADRFLSEAHNSRCAASGIPVLRRISGGGAVVQGPGCLNYALILDTDVEGLGTIADGFRYVLERHRRVIEGLTGLKVRIEGISDLVLDGRKFSGNAQYRKRSCVLVHGTFLLNLELGLMERYLALPQRQPEYRRQRAHSDFVVNLHLDASAVRAGLIEVWGADREFTKIPRQSIERLARSRYWHKDWLGKF